MFVVLPNEEAPRNAKKMGKKMLGATNAGCRSSSLVERTVSACVCRSERAVLIAGRPQGDAQLLRRKRHQGLAR
jgi:hypothetical protein